MANITNLIQTGESERVDYNKLSTYEIVDALLKYFKTHEDKGLPFPTHAHSEALDYLDQFDLLRYKAGSRHNIAYITPFGREIADKGFANFLQELREKVEQDKQRQKLTDDKLKYDLKNSKRIFKTYWWTFFFALVSFIYVVIQVIFKCIELF